MTYRGYPSLCLPGGAIALTLLLAGCANVSHGLTKTGPCARAAVEICKQSGAGQDCRCIRRSAFSGDAFIRLP